MTYISIPGTDVGAEMGNLKSLVPFKDCHVCKKAHTAATGMLAVSRDFILTR